MSHKYSHSEISLYSDELCNLLNLPSFLQNAKLLFPPFHFTGTSVFPIIAKDGGVLVRAGHTEASVDISKLAKKNNSAVICEIMNDDGTMSKGQELHDFAKKHKLKIGKIEDLISYRLKKEKLTRLKNNPQ